jgi:nitrogen regulatory protein PII
MSELLKIEAYVRTTRVEAIQESLNELGTNDVTVTETGAIGRRRGVSHTFRGSQYTLNMIPEAKIEVVVSDSDLDEYVAAIRDAAATGESGDGRIIVTRVEQVYNLDTGESGSAAVL